MDECGDGSSVDESMEMVVVWMREWRWYVSSETGLMLVLVIMRTRTKYWVR